MAELAKLFEVYPGRIVPWKAQLQEGAAEFMAAYHAAQANEQPPIGEARAVLGSMSALSADWYALPVFTGLRAPSQRTYRRLLENFLKDHGSRIVA